VCVGGGCVGGGHLQHQAAAPLHPSESYHCYLSPPFASVASFWARQLDPERAAAHAAHMAKMQQRGTAAAGGQHRLNRALL
jgi:hypothetical protein